MLLSTMQGAESEAKERLLSLRQEIAYLECVKSKEYGAIADTRKGKTEVYNQKESIEKQLTILSSILEETKIIRKQIKYDLGKESVKYQETVDRLESIITNKQRELERFNNIDLEKKLKEDMRLKEEIDQKVLQISVINDEIKQYEHMKKTLEKDKKEFTEFRKQELKDIQRQKEDLSAWNKRLLLQEKRILSLKKDG